MLYYTDITQTLNGLGDNGNWKLWTSLWSKNDSCQLWCLSTRRSAGGAARQACYVTTQHSSVMYTTSNRKYKYDMNNFAVTINGFMSLTSYFDEKYRY